MEEIVAVPTIMALVYVIVEVYKLTWAHDNEKMLKIIPIISLALGFILGIVAFYAAPTIIPANNVLSALLIGGVSGLGATGTNQIFKQFTKKKEEV